MAIVFVQSKAATAQGSGATSFTFSPTSPLAYGNTAFLIIACTDNGVLPTTIDSDLGNAFTRVKRFQGASRCVDCYQADGLVAGADVFTIHFSGGKSGVGVTFLEYTPNAGTILSLNQQDTDSDAAGVTSYPCGTITTTDTGELILAAGRIGSASITISPEAGYTTRSGTTGVNSSYVMELITTTPVTVTPTPTGSGTTGYAGMVMSFTGIADTSKVRADQNIRFVPLIDTTPKARMDQNMRYVIYAFTQCNPISAGGLIKADTDIDGSRFPLTGGDDVGEEYQAFVKTGAYRPGDTIHKLGEVGQEQQPILIARAGASDDVEIQLEVDRDRGAELVTGIVDLTPEASETRVIRKFEGVQASDAGVTQFKLGDEVETANRWSLDRLHVRTTPEGDR